MDSFICISRITLKLNYVPVCCQYMEVALLDMCKSPIKLGTYGLLGIVLCI